MKKVLLILFMLVYFHLIPAEAAKYGIARTYTPVLNVPNFKDIFGGVTKLRLKTDRCGQVRELEYIAMPGSIFMILGEHGSETSKIFQVQTEEYANPPNVRLYIDSRFIQILENVPKPRNPELPLREIIISRLKASLGSPYVWGGNVLSGVPELTSLYYKNIKSVDTRSHILAGLDCSGLLYYATEGITPRNTSQLITYGQGLMIADKSSSEIAATLQPLDLIVWNGHVIIVLDRYTVIESRLECGKPGNGGVVISQLLKRLDEIMRTRSPANVWLKGKKQGENFVVRRWFSGK
jgi:hypothetical protein